MERAEVLEEIRRLEGAVDGCATTVDLKIRGRIPAGAVYEHFDNLDDARREALSTPAAWPPVADRAQVAVARDVRRAANAVGGAPTSAEYERHGELGFRAALEEFGSWLAACAAAGVRAEWPDADEPGDLPGDAPLFHTGGAIMHFRRCNSVRRMGDPEVVLARSLEGDRRLCGNCARRENPDGPAAPRRAEPDGPPTSPADLMRSDPEDLGLSPVGGDGR